MYPSYNRSFAPPNRPSLQLSSTSYFPTRASPRQPIPPRTCPFYLENRCKYGSKCYFSHPPADQDCSICLEKIKASGELFGFLPNCAHIFCLKCIRTWREKGKESNGKLCPCCRKLSYYVISSRRLFNTPEEKEIIHKEYLEKLLTIPCKLFNYGEGKCTFGKKCLYGHFDRQGKVVPKVDLKREFWKKKKEEEVEEVRARELRMLGNLLDGLILGVDMEFLWDDDSVESDIYDDSFEYEHDPDSDDSFDN